MRALLLVLGVLLVTLPSNLADKGTVEGGLRHSVSRGKRSSASASSSLRASVTLHELEERAVEAARAAAERVLSEVGGEPNDFGAGKVPLVEFIAKKLKSSAAKAVNRKDQRCVMCQFFVQRIHSEMLMNGIGGSVPFGPHPFVGAAVAFQSLAGQVTNPATFFQPAPLHSGYPVIGAGSGSFLEEAATTSLTQQDQARSAPVMMQMTERDMMQRRGAPGKHPWTALHTRYFGQSVETHRDRLTGMLKYRPQQTRYSNIFNGPVEAAKRAQERFENNAMYEVVYETMQHLCKLEVPMYYYVDCLDLLARFQKVLECLKFRTRADMCCRQVGMCEDTSYVAKGPHSGDKVEE